MRTISEDKVLVMGGLIVDKYFLMNKYPSRGEDALIKDSFYKVGGCAINVACTLKNLGIDTYPVSTIGMDENGSLIEKFLLDNNINNDCVAVERNRDTGYCMVILDHTLERTFMTYKGCEEIFSYNLISSNLMKEITFVYLTGYYLLGSYAPEILRFIKDIKKMGTSVLFDPGPLVDELEVEILGSALELCDILIPNANEVEKIKIKLDIEEEFYKWTQKQKIKYLIIKNGVKGVTAYKDNKKYEIPAYNVETKDTTGAGDSFAAGCIYGFLNNLEFEKILYIGSACGALNAALLGPNGKYSNEDVERLMRGEVGYA